MQERLVHHNIRKMKFNEMVLDSPQKSTKSQIAITKTEKISNQIDRYSVYQNTDTSNNYTQTQNSPKKTPKNPFKTSTGISLPIITFNQKKALFDLLKEIDMLQRTNEMAGRTITEFVVKALGGARRFGDRIDVKVNVVIISSTNQESLFGICCGRQLCLKGANVYLVTERKIVNNTKSSIIQ